MATLSAKDRRTLLFWQIAHSDVRRPLRWVESLKRTIDVLTSTSPTEEAAALFWIRLHGVLHQFLEVYQPSPNTPLTGSPDPAEQQAAEEADYFADLAAGALAACVQLRAAFTPDDLSAIQWLRDYEAHPELSAYDLKERKGQLETAGKHALTGNIPHAHVHAAVRALRKDRDDVAVAVELARRAGLHVDELIAALVEFPNVK
jgi:hypothetical protein